MAGMEQLEIHSRSYLIRWVKVTADHSISWSIQPKKRTIHFGIFKHPGSTGGHNQRIPSTTTLNESHDDAHRVDRQGSETSLPDGNTLSDKLQKLGMTQVSWQGKCEADRVTMGHHDVPHGQEGMYGLVFDNTQSKQFSKTVTFVLMTYPTDAPPASGSNSHMALAQALAGRGNRRVSPSKRGSYIAARNESSERVYESDGSHTGGGDKRQTLAAGTESITSSGASFYTGVLSKRRRKQHQGYAKRFFSLDFTSSTLSYYKNRSSSALRGSIPLSLAAIGADEKSRQISVDSGAEIWLLRAHNRHEFSGWRDALERATQPVQSPVKTTPKAFTSLFPSAAEQRSSVAEDQEWESIEALLSQVSGITDSVRRIAKDTDPKYMSNNLSRESTASSPTEPPSEEYFPNGPPRSPKPPFWRRKSSNQSQPFSNPLSRSISAGRLAPPSPDALMPIKTRDRSPPKRPVLDDPAKVHERCMAVMRDLDAVVANFSNLLAQSKERRFPPSPGPISRSSMDSIGGQEFFDAEDGEGSRSSRFLEISRDQDAVSEHGDAVSINSASTISLPGKPAMPDGAAKYFPAKPKSLYPLPHDPVSRRSTIPPAKGQPPSLFAFLRKNVGKDLSTIAMPVTANEPLSLLQKFAEPLEYADLLTNAAATPEIGESTASKRLLLVTAFALSSLSANRAKERAVRKPFNPMLGETYELVREDLGFRFLAEKVTHRPVRVASQAEGGFTKAAPHCTWTYTHAPSPSQKFWGKSAELVTDGQCRVQLHTTGERYCWSPAHAFLRNIVAGEKYFEPVGSVTVTEETSGRRAVVNFKSGGMFSGRSEEVSIACYDGVGRALSVSASGTWTGGVHADSGDVIWKANSLLTNSNTRFGFTPFAATLNDTTPMEENNLPPTDSRLRPDQRAYENGLVDQAETLKLKLEEAQRRRRKDMENHGEEWNPRWFERMTEKRGEDGEEVWRMRGSDEPSVSYWDVRKAVVESKKGEWDGVRNVFEM